MGVGAGARKDIAGQVVGAGALGRLGPRLWPWPGAQRTHYPGHEKGFGGEHVAASRRLVSASHFCSSFISPHLHPGFPRKAWFSHCTRWPLQKNAIGSFQSKVWPWVVREEITEVGSERARDVPEVT